MSFFRNASEGNVDVADEEENRPRHLQGRCDQQGRNALGLAEHDPTLTPFDSYRNLFSGEQRFYPLHQLAEPAGDLLLNQIWWLEEVNAKL